ncbi:hypothetical protein NH26_10720 [Flammeovirga pacifica]|uniref:DUF5723 domain-containing protein n=2 Tax=Flammeovirga pacifica TaxID=915059 RepID=A0A1S1Z111_FLAPC|nr:hypothetical protein NH26_10720 [Flammeovirga pacifica]
MMPLGAASQAKGNQFLFSNDVWGSANDLSSIMTRSPQIGMTHRSIFQEVAFSAVGAIYPINQKWSTSATISSVGNTYLSEQSIELGTAHKIGIIQIGGGLGYHQLRAETLNTLQTITLNMAVQAALSSRFSLGLIMHNFTQNVYQEGVFGADKSSLIALGVKYSVQPFFTVISSIEKQKHQQIQYKAGFEYQWKSFLYLRGGMQLFPLDISLGTGVYKNKWGVDYAFLTDDVFGWSHQFSLSYQLTSKER